jgi:hypothetical protein
VTVANQPGGGSPYFEFVFTGGTSTPVPSGKRLILTFMSIRLYENFLDLFRVRMPVLDSQGSETLTAIYPTMSLMISVPPTQTIFGFNEFVGNQPLELILDAGQSLKCLADHMGFNPAIETPEVDCHLFGRLIDAQ